jgi:arylsulfatase A-like enzyme
MISKYLPDNDPRVVNYRLDDMLDKMLWANVGYYVSKNGGTKFAPSEFLTDYFASEAVRAIEANKHRPFFLYMAFTSPHTPLQALRDDYDKLSHIEDELTRVYGAIILSLDRAVGTILDALTKQGIRDDTIVIFTNDNGAPSWVMRNGANKPFRGWKGTLFEGGLRVPMFMQWPKYIQPGSVVNDMMGHVDILPTILASAGVATDEGRSNSVDGGSREVMGDKAFPLDGVNLLPIINHAQRRSVGVGEGYESSGGGTPDAPHKSLFWRSGHYKAIRKGDWKLQVAARPSVEWLFNLKQDPYEMNNLASSEQHVGIREELINELLQIDGEQSEPLWASITETAVSIDKFFEHDEKEDDEYVYWPN